MTTNQDRAAEVLGRERYSRSLQSATASKLDPRLQLVDIMDGEATVVLRDNPNTYYPFVHRVTVGGDEIARDDGTIFETPTYTGWAEGIAGIANSAVGAIYPTRTAAANSLLEDLLWAAERKSQ